MTEQSMDDHERLPIASSMDEMAGFLESRVERKGTVCMARLEALSSARSQMVTLLECINPACGEDVWIRRRESLERQIAETDRETFRVKLELIENAVERELFELRRRLALVKRLSDQ
jgi:hypothetical protein